MDQLDRHADAQGLMLRNVEQPGAGSHEKRPHALAAIQRCMAHRLMQPGLGAKGLWQDLMQQRLDGIGMGLEIALEVAHGLRQAPPARH